MGDNPVDCFAFIDSNERVYKDRTLDCCWTANEKSELPSRLKNLVTIHPDGAVSLLYSKFEFCIFLRIFLKVWLFSQLTIFAFDGDFYNK